MPRTQSAIALAVWSRKTTV